MEATGLVGELARSLAQQGVGARLLSADCSESDEISAWLEASFPMAAWGKIDWEKVSDSHSLEWRSPEEVLKAFRYMYNALGLERSMKSETIIFVIWSNALDPILVLQWDGFIAHKEEVLRADSTLWVICKEKNWCMEKNGVGTFSFGLAKP